MISIAFRKLMLEHPNIVREAVLTDHQIDTIKAVRFICEYESYASSPQVADKIGCSVPAASTLLSRLADKGYLKRLNIGDPTGGTMYGYRLEDKLDERYEMHV